MADFNNNIFSTHLSTHLYIKTPKIYQFPITKSIRLRHKLLVGCIGFIIVVDIRMRVIIELLVDLLLDFLLIFLYSPIIVHHICC
jgi:hypothetical protein